MLCSHLLLAGLAQAQSTSFTYQGRLTDAGQAAQGSYELRLSLFSADSGGSPVAGPLTNGAVVVSNGLFTTTLDFGADVFDGTNLWLEIAVRTNGSPSDFTALDPRQAVTRAPYTLFARRANSMVNPSFLGTTNDSPLQLLVNNAPALRLEPNDFTPNIVAGFAGNVVLNNAYGVTISGGGYLDQTNRASGSFAAIGGGADNLAGSIATVGGGANNQATGSGSTISGGTANRATGLGCAIGGGAGNTASDENSTVAGGVNNVASGYNSTIVGGINNTASNAWSFIGGGRVNVAGGESSAVAGGGQNAATGAYAAIGGGYNNQASGNFSTISGGDGNVAQGRHSFAAGQQAYALQDGCFVWSDRTPGGVGSFGENTFVARASGGARFYSSTDLITGVTLDAGAGSWSSLSDRNAKENFRPVDGQDVLERLASIPLQTWNYKSQNASIRHIGPTAQDFRAAFGLGESEQRISTVDADGVALGAIQGLNTKLEQQRTENARLKKELAELRNMVEAIKQKPGAQ